MAKDRVWSVPSRFGYANGPFARKMLTYRRRIGTRAGCAGGRRSHSLAQFLAVGFKSAMGHSRRFRHVWGMSGLGAISEVMSPRLNRPGAGGSVFVLIKLANVMLRVEFKSQLGDEIKLSFEEIDVFFLIVHELLEQIARHIIANRMAMRSGFLIKRAC